MGGEGYFPPIRRGNMVLLVGVGPVFWDMHTPRGEFGPDRSSRVGRAIDSEQRSEEIERYCHVCVTSENTLELNGRPELLPAVEQTKILPSSICR